MSQHRCHRHAYQDMGRLHAVDQPSPTLLLPLLPPLPPLLLPPLLLPLPLPLPLPPHRGTKSEDRGKRGRPERMSSAVSGGTVEQTQAEVKLKAVQDDLKEKEAMLNYVNARWTVSCKFFPFQTDLQEPRGNVSGIQSSVLHHRLPDR
jgi:hypothetical protein